MLAAGTTLALMVGALLPAISRAAAQTYCVHQAGFRCPDGTFDEGINLQTALTSAAGNPSTFTSPNVITIAPGTYRPPTSGSGFTVTTVNPLQIIGAGIDQTTLTDANTAAIVQLHWPVGSSVSGLTVSGTNDFGLEMNGGAADDIAVEMSGSLAGGVDLANARLESATIALPQTGTAGVVTSSGSNIDSNQIDDVTVQGGSEGVEADAGTTIRRAKLLDTATPLFVSSVPAYIEDSLLIGSTGIHVQDDPTEGSVNALNDTIVAAGSPTDGVETFSDGNGDTDAQIINTIVRGFQTSFLTSGANATIEGLDDNYDGPTSGSGVNLGATVPGNPDFVNPGAGDYRLAWNSPLIDSSSTTTLGSSSTIDLDGQSRVVSYTHASTPVDLGAYEYQHRPPTARPEVLSYAGDNPKNFSGSLSSDPDDGDTLSYAWSFDDGATATGATVTHAFGTTGAHTVTLTVTDPTGLTSQQSTTVWVLPPPPWAGPPVTPWTPPVTPASTNPASPHLSVVGRPSVTGDKVTLKLACTGTTACSGIDVTETTVENQEARKRTVPVASVTLRLNPGQITTITVTLNGKGKALLKRVAKLPITIAVTIPIAGKTATVETAHAILHPPKKPRHRHPAAA